MGSTTISAKNINYPPGGVLIWMIVFLELLTFGIALLVFLHYRQTDMQLFNSSQQMLNKTLGTTNTLVLITSGFFMANGLISLKSGRDKVSLNWLYATVFMGLLFLTLKGFEYSDKLEHGIGLSYNKFFMFYWILTGFHFIHVLVGVLILSYMIVKIRQKVYSGNNLEDVETAGVFWHMCDLIWIFLFPILYLLH
jgi:nitric oxide reductase NorE protein